MMDNSGEGSSQSTLPQIKVFQTIQKNLSAMGIIKRRPINARIFLSLLTLGLATIFELIYIINEAQTFFQYTESIYICSAFILASSYLTILIIHSNEMFQMINAIECTANTSK